MEPIRRDPHALVPGGGRIAIFRALPGLGDLLAVTPALRALRRARPDVHVTYVGLPETEALVARYPRYVDDFLTFPGFPGLPDRRPDLRAIPGFIKEAQAAHFDLAIQLHGSGVLTNPIVGLFDARRTAGHVPPGASLPDRTFLPWVERCSEVRRSLRLMAHLGWESDDERLDFEIADATTAAAVDGPYVVVHPGASVAARRWTAAGFLEVADALTAHGYRVVLTGSLGERARNREIAEAMRVPPLDLTGRTTLDELGATLRGSRLLVSNDTGVAHLAVALGVPSVVVFTGSDPERWAALDPARHRAVPGSARRVVAEAKRMLAASPVKHAA